jgi:hypothetical protein
MAASAAAHASEPITDFTYPWTDKPAPRTEVAIRNADDALHFTFTVDDPDIVVTEKWTGENTLDGEDRVEIFFAKDKQLKQYWCIEIDSQGRVHDYQASHYRNFDNTWNYPGLKTTAERTSTGYKVTATIPLATLSQLLGMPVQKGTEVRLGLFRAEFYGTDPATHGNANDNWISWVRPNTEKPDFHVPSAFRLWEVPGERE